MNFNQHVCGFAGPPPANVHGGPFSYPSATACPVFTASAPVLTFMRGNAPNDYSRVADLLVLDILPPADIFGIKTVSMT